MGIPKWIMNGFYALEQPVEISAKLMQLVIFKQIILRRRLK